MTRSRTALLALLLLSVFPAPSLHGYPLPPKVTPEVPPDQEFWTTPASAALEEAEDHYFMGIEAYLDGESDLAATYFARALDLLEGAAHENGSLPEEHDLLRRKAAYLLSKVSGSGDNGIVYVEERRPLGPPAEPVDELPELPIVADDHTERWLAYFSREAGDRFATYLARSGRYESLVRSTLRAHGLPEDLAYLPLIESGYNPRAYSVAHAAGVWQFIRSTAKRCGLRVDYWVDERRDPEKSCEAAARHLRSLWEIFESWPLVLAAYNAGEKRVMDAILSAGTRDFSKLRLPRQTRDYLPRFMAGALIAKNPEDYGFAVRYEPPLAYDILEVDQATDLDLIARCCASSVQTLKSLNPSLRRECTPPGERGYRVRIPPGTLARCEANLYKIPKEERLASQSQSTTHRVRRGETLSHIAARYGTTVSQIASANNLRSAHLIREDQKLTIPAGTHFQGARVVPAGDDWQEDGEKIVYVVKKGDTLEAIARVHNTRVDHLRKWNGLGRNHYIIHPGDRLLIFVPRGS